MLTKVKSKTDITSRTIDKAHQFVLRAVHATLQRGGVVVDTERCKGCGLCVVECPAHTLRLSDTLNTSGYKTSQQILPDKCIGCASCALVCPDGCIAVRRTSLVPHSALQTDKLWTAK